LLVQSGRSAAAAELARADTETSVFRFADSVGPPEVFTAARLPAVAALFEEIHRDDEAAVSRSKDTFARPRPCGLEPRLQPVFACPTSGSYPSGHATFGWSVALVLADMLPERRSQVLARARQYTWNRVVAGVHYPSDVEAGRTSATVIVALLFADAEFRARERRAAAELRLALGLPALAASR
jgi:acid phosphatase (class A)